MKACDASADFPVRAAGSLPLMKFRPVDISLVAVLSGNAHAITPSPSMVSAREQLQVWPAKKLPRQSATRPLTHKVAVAGAQGVARLDHHVDLRADERREDHGNDNQRRQQRRECPCVETFPLLDRRELDGAEVSDELGDADGHDRLEDQLVH